MRTADADCDLILEFLQAGTAFLQNEPVAYDHFYNYLSRAQSPMAIALAMLTVRLWGIRTPNAAAERVLLDAWEKVPVYVREQLNGLRVAAAQVRFNTYLRLP